MYEYLKDLLPVAELVGEPEKIACYSGDKIMGNMVDIHGETPEGLKFQLRLTIEEAEADA